jgi:hypothetical protein
MSLAWRGRQLRKVATLRVIPQTKTIAHLVLHSKIKGAAAKAEEAAAEVEAVAEADAIKRKGSGTVFFTKKMTTTVRIIAQTRKGLKPSLRRKKEKERNSLVNHSAPTWQNPNFGSVDG